MASIKSKMSKNELYQPYITINMSSALSEPVEINGSYKRLLYPKIGIYNGPGASHSWLWFVEILDAMGFWDIDFVDDHYIKNGGLNNLHVLLVSGGDTFAIAESLGKEGAEKIKGFLDEGGLYIGSCAGAYLPLNSSLPPLNLFNLASVKISNLTSILPESVAMPEKFCTPYGCSYIFHPVREEVKITLFDFPSLKKNDEVVAPLYGGPSFLPSEDVKTLARYTGFTNHTLFLTDQQLAHDTLIGNSAVVSKRISKGHIFLLGPHLEHPYYLKANTLIADMIYQGIYEQESTRVLPNPLHKTINKKLHNLWRGIKSEVSNARIVAQSLERNTLTWQIGHKVYEPAKIRAFLEMVWSRISQMEHMSRNVEEDELLKLRVSFQVTTQLLREIKREAAKGRDTTDKASYIITEIKNICADFFRNYFNIKLYSLTEDPRRYINL